MNKKRIVAGLLALSMVFSGAVTSEAGMSVVNTIKTQAYWSSDITDEEYGYITKGDFVYRSYTADEYYDDNTDEYYYEEYYELVAYTGTDANVVIPATVDGKKVTTIYSNAFFDSEKEDEDCNVIHNTTLKTITIPQYVKDIPTDAFRYCDALTKVTIDQRNENYTCENLMLFNKDKTHLCGFFDNNATSVMVPEGVEDIEYGVSDYNNIEKLWHRLYGCLQKQCEKGYRYCNYHR